MASAMTALLLDAHAHVWDLHRTPQPWIEPASMAAIHRNFTLADLEEAYRSSHIAGGIVVQSSHSLQETRDLLALVSASAIVRGVVGWVDLADDVSRQVANHSAGMSRPGLVGIRHLIHQEPDHRWLTRAAVARGLDALGQLRLPFDLVIRHEQLPLATQVVREHPGTRFVLDHLANPPAGAGFSRWANDLEAIARCENVSAKLSGLVSRPELSDWTFRDVEPALREALQLFGPSRLLFGTDWPLVKLAGGIPGWIDAVSLATSDLSQAERDGIFFQNARELYGLDC